nr:BPK_HP1_G0043710.mRNA.1.CDS.1 [Saccharomyces cerevisiae]
MPCSPIHIKNYRFIKPSSATNSESDNEPGGSSGYDADSDTDIFLTLKCVPETPTLSNNLVSTQ